MPDDPTDLTRPGPRAGELDETCIVGYHPIKTAWLTDALDRKIAKEDKASLLDRIFMLEASLERTRHQAVAVTRRINSNAVRVTDVRQMVLAAKCCIRSGCTCSMKNDSQSP